MAKRTSSLPLLKNIPIKADPINITAPCPEVRWVKVTPDVATKWLEETNTSNRKVREDYVIRLACDMTEGRWKGKNGEAIRFDKEGRLVDGQHRLWACVLSGKSFDSLLVTGVNNGEYSTIGIGMKKSLADFLGPMSGKKNTALLSSTLRLVFHQKNGSLDKLKDGRIQPTVLKLQQLLKDNPEIEESCSFIAGHKEIRSLANPTFSALIHYVGSESGYQAKVEAFLEKVGNGLGMTAEDPAYQLRKFLLGLRGLIPGRRRPAQQYILAVTIKAWNAAKEGKRLSFLKFDNREEFPKL